MTIRLACLLLLLLAGASPTLAGDAPSKGEAGPTPEAEEPGLPADVIDVLVIDREETYDADAATSPTRTPTPLEEIPQSVTVITRPLIEDQQASTASEALTNAGAVLSSNPLLTPSFDSTRIRGFPAEQAIDGFTQYYNPGDRQSLVDVERIEVLRGPNGLVYGGGAGAPVGGLVNLVSKEPRAIAAWTVGTRVGSDELVQPFFDVNVPIADWLRVRMTGEYTSAESEIDVLDSRRFNVSPALTLTNGDSTSLTLRGKISRWRQHDYQGLPAAGTVAEPENAIDPALLELLGIPPASGNQDIEPHLFIGPSDIEDSRSSFDSGSFRLVHRFDGRRTLEVQARYARSEFDERAQLVVGSGLDFGADRPIIEPPAVSEFFGYGTLPFALFDARLFQEQEEVSAIATFVSQDAWGPVRTTLLLGADYSRYDDAGFLRSAPSGGFTLSFVDLGNPSFDLEYVTPGDDENDNFVVNEIWGGYVQLQASLFERVHLLGGVRRGRVEIDFRGPDNADLTREDRWIPRAGAVLDLIGGLSVFGGYSEGMRGQPFAIFTKTPEPETSRQIEGGVRLRRGDWLRFQAAYFEIERDNVVVPDPEGGLGSVPRGSQASHGFEVELSVRASDALSLLATYARTTATFEDDLFASFGSGLDAIPGVPKHSGRLWINYDFPGWLEGLRIGAGLYGQSGTQISRRNAFFSDGFLTVDATVGYEAEHFSLGLRGSNLTGKEYFDRLGYLDARVTPGPGRAWRLTLAVHF